MTYIASDSQRGVLYRVIYLDKVSVRSVDCEEYDNAGVLSPPTGRRWGKKN